MGCGGSVHDTRSSSQSSRVATHRATTTVISPGVSQSHTTMGRKSKTELNADGPQAAYGIITLVPPVDFDNRSNSNATSFSASKETDPFALNSVSQRPSEFSNSIAGAGSINLGPEFGLFTGSCYAVFGPNKDLFIKNYMGGFMHPELKDVHMPTARERRRAKLSFFSDGPPPASTGFPFNARGLLLLHPQRELEPLPLAAFQPLRISNRDASELESHLRVLEGPLLTHERYLSGSEDAARLLNSSCVKMNPVLVALVRHLSIRARDLAVLLKYPEVILKGIAAYDLEKSRAAFRRRCAAKVTGQAPAVEEEAGMTERKSDDIVGPSSPSGASAVEDSFDEPEDLVKWSSEEPDEQKEVDEKDDEEKWLEFLKQEIVLDLHYTVQLLRCVVRSIAS